MFQRKRSVSFGGYGWWVWIHLFPRAKVRVFPMASVTISKVGAFRAYAEHFERSQIQSFRFRFLSRWTIREFSRAILQVSLQVNFLGWGVAAVHASLGLFLSRSMAQKHASCIRTNECSVAHILYVGDWIARSNLVVFACVVLCTEFWLGPGGRNKGRKWIVPHLSTPESSIHIPRSFQSLRSWFSWWLQPCDHLSILHEMLGLARFLFWNGKNISVLFVGSVTSVPNVKAKSRYMKCNKNVSFPTK